MAEIRFTRGAPLTFRATRSFSLGANNLQLRKGDEVLFDGQIATLNGETFPAQLKGAIKAGWLVLDESYDEDDPTYNQRPTANIQVRAPNGGNPLAPVERTSMVTTESDEREVMKTGAHAKAVQQHTQAARATGQVNTNGGMAVMTSADQEGIPVRSLKTPAKSRNELRGDNAGTLISGAVAPTLETHVGMTQEEMLERMTETQREEYLAKTGALRSAYDADAGTSQRSVVAKVKTTAGPQTREGFNVSTSVGVGSQEVADPTGMGGKAEESVVVVDGITLRNTNGPKRPEQPHPRAAETRKAAGPDPRRMVAKTLCKDFPDNYDFTAPLKKRLARLQADFEDRSDVIRAAFAAESDEMKAYLLDEFPAAFVDEAG
jgi:hypothetical protein